MSKVGFEPVGGYSDFFGYLSWISKWYSVDIIENNIQSHIRVLDITHCDIRHLDIQNYVEYKDVDILAQILYAWPNIMIRLLISVGLGVTSK
jgi:hypothetical protein